MPGQDGGTLRLHRDNLGEPYREGVRICLEREGSEMTVMLDKESCLELAEKLAAFVDHQTCPLKTREDLKGVPTVSHNGRSAEEWYQLYAQQAVLTDKLRQALQGISKHQQTVAGNMSKLSVTRRLAEDALSFYNQQIPKTGE